MSNTVRLVNGGTIHVKTGVIQGIGPVGPRGVAGPQGPDGPTGPVGEQGAQGQILAQQSLSKISAINNIAANTDVLVAFGNPVYDHLACMGPAATQITLTNAGDYLISCYLEFAAGTATKREMWFSTGGAVIARKSVVADTGIFFLDLSFPYKVVTGPEVVNVYARSAVATTIAVGGAVAVNRIGSGPKGDPGPPGPDGPQGIQGVKGDTGPVGSASTGYATYDDLF
jgi:hypothetical protein